MLAGNEVNPVIKALRDSVGLERVTKRSGPAPTDRFEEEPAKFFERVREAYLELAHAEPNRIRIVNAAGTVEEVQKAVAAVLESLER